jgi:segregation and condensation protein A
MHKIQLDQFEGPLDLLLQLIEKNELQITEISLANVTDQYLDHIENSENLASDEVADFLLIASKLIYLKSKYLLPDFSMEGEEDALDLEKQLKIYRQYYEASKKINKMFVNKNKHSYTRSTPFKLDTSEEFIAPTNVDQNSLAEAFANVLSRIERVVNLPKIVLAKAISISEKIRHIKDVIKEKTNFSFRSLFKEKKDKTEVVVSFLAMLELVKQEEIEVHQVEMFGDLNINRNGK